MITDNQYLAFMQRLAEDQRGKNPLILPDYERGFLDNFTQASRPSLWFTPGRRGVTDKMWRRLGPDLNYPHPEDRIDAVPAIVAAPDGCEYLVKDETGQHRCNEPAVVQEQRKMGRLGLRYCKCHGEQAELAMKRAKIPFTLIPYKHTVSAALLTSVKFPPV